MAAHEKYTPPHRQLLELGVEAKLMGKTFEQWWHDSLPVRGCPHCYRSTLSAVCPSCEGKTNGPKPPTVGMADPPSDAVLWPKDAVDRRIWLAAIDESKDGWRRAYEELPPLRREAALPYLLHVLGELDPDEAGGFESAAAVA